MDFWNLDIFFRQIARNTNWLSNVTGINFQRCSAPVPLNSALLSISIVQPFEHSAIHFAKDRPLFPSADRWRVTMSSSRSTFPTITFTFFHHFPLKFPETTISCYSFFATTGVLVPEKTKYRRCDRTEVGLSLRSRSSAMSEIEQRHCKRINRRGTTTSSTFCSSFLYQL